MTWVVVALIVLAFVGTWMLLGWQPLGRRQRREDFEHFVKSLLIMMENGGALHIEERGSEVEFELVREQGGDDDAVVLLRVPRAEWSDEKAQQVFRVFDSNDFDTRLVENSTSKVSVEVRVLVDNIWEEWSGAKCARAAHLLLDALSVPKNARFNLSLVGQPSKRGIAHERDLRQQGRA